MTARFAAWLMLVVIALIVVAAAFSLLDRRPPITHLGRDFLGWTGEHSFVVDYKGVRHRRCEATATRRLLNGSGRNIHEYAFAPYDIPTEQQANLDVFISPPRTIDVPHGIDLTQPLTLTLEVRYVCSPLQALWPIVVLFPPLPVPLPKETVP